MSYVLLVLLVLFIIGVEFGLVMRARHGRTPHDIRKRGRYDAFLSYKSEDAPLARVCAELLLAKGVRVWFDEYVILLAESDQFKDEIKAGILKSRYGICLTSDAYYSSEWCTMEAELLDKKYSRKRERVIKADLSEYPTTGDLMRFIEMKTGWRISQPPYEPALSQSNKRRLKHPGSRIVLLVDTSGWDGSELSLPNAPRIIGDCGIGFDLSRPYLGRWIRCAVRLKPATSLGHRRPDGADDIRMLLALKAEAQDLFGSLDSVECLGVHIIQALGERHAAFTLYAGTLPTGWHRIYRVLIDGENGSEPWEAEFEFQFPGTFREFCGIAYLMDLMVASLSRAQVVE